MASPYERNLYFSFLAVAYACMIRSNPPNAQAYLSNGNYLVVDKQTGETCKVVPSMNPPMSGTDGVIADCKKPKDYILYGGLLVALVGVGVLIYFLKD